MQLTAHHGMPAKADYRLPFISAVTRVGLDPATMTLYSLRHSSIARALLAGVPTRVVEARHDTSVPMLERTYSQHILDHSDIVARRALLYTAQPAADPHVHFQHSRVARPIVDPGILPRYLEGQPDYSRC